MMQSSPPQAEAATVGVIGLGFLGRGIATCLLGHGLHVVGHALSDADHQKARQHIEKGIDELIEHDSFDPQLRTEWKSRYLEVQSLEPFKDCQLVIESISEDLAAKQLLFEQIEQVIDPKTPIASNTSALPITLLQSQRKHPERFIGMHWAEPAHATGFLELISGEQTSAETLQAVFEFGKRIGKDPSIVSKDVPGFLVNRMGYALYREALALLESGVADAETIDRSFRNACGLWATMCGPLRWIDLTGGPEAYAKAMAPVLPSLNNQTNVPQTIQQLADQGARGIINGHGFFEYTEEEAEAWRTRYRDHAWLVSKLMRRYDSSKESPGTESE